MVSRRVQALLDQLRAQGIQDEQVLNALAAVPREKFVDEAFEQKAWDNIALPIGQGQTISQPYMVARMTELLELTPQSRVLEIGTGSGYQTAILPASEQRILPWASAWLRPHRRSARISGSTSAARRCRRFWWDSG